jgi:hypothetical protein
MVGGVLRDGGGAIVKWGVPDDAGGGANDGGVSMDMDGTRDTGEPVPINDDDGCREG